MSYAEFDYWFVKKYVPDHICDVIIENYTDFTEGMIRTNELNDVRKSGVCWVNEPFYKNLVFDIICRQNRNSGLNFQLDCLEDVQITRYVAPDGHFDFHIDGNGHARENVDNQNSSFIHITSLDLEVTSSPPRPELIFPV